MNGNNINLLGTSTLLDSTRSFLNGYHRIDLRELSEVYIIVRASNSQGICIFKQWLVFLLLYLSNVRTVLSMVLKN